MDENFFQIGDVVTLKSPGPNMTVCGTENDGYVFCKWFDGGDCNNGTFHQDTLILIPEDER